MKRKSNGRAVAHITLDRAARLHRVVALFAAGPRTRDELLAELGIGLRTFYRELELLKRCGVEVRLDKRHYTLKSSVAEARGRLPFPDPQLSFAEMDELAACPGPAGQRLAALLARVVSPPEPAASTRRRKARGKGAGGTRGPKPKL